MRGNVINKGSERRNNSVLQQNSIIITLRLMAKQDFAMLENYKIIN